MNLLLLDPAGVGQDGVARIGGAQASHLLTVLKVEPGQTVRVGLIDGPCGIGTVVSTSREAVDLRCAFDAAAPPRPPVDLLLALPRPKVMRRLWAQLAAIGVGRIILTNAGRVERDYFDAHVLMEPYYRPLLIEGLQQARDTQLPLVTVHRRFKVLVEDDLDRLCPEGRRLVAHPGGQSVTDIVGATPHERVLLAVGPEGGWNEFELRLLESHRFQRVGMGARTQRTDTACALLALVHALLQQ